MLPELWTYMGGIARDQNIRSLAIGGTTDHVHILLSLPGTITIAKAVGLIKGNSSKWLGQKDVQPFAWQEGYAAFSVSKNVINKVSAYIHNQKEHHQQVSFQEESASMGIT